MAKAKKNLSQRAQKLLGGSEQDHIQALEAWSKCIQEAQLEIEKKFTEEEWKLLGTVYTTSDSPLFHPAVPLTVILEHIIADFMLLPNEFDTELAPRVVAKIKKIASLEGYALGYILKEYAASKGALEEKQWWLAEQRVASS